MTLHLDYPLYFDSWGWTAITDEDEHIRDLIEQLLLTAPGERVNRPTLGSGVLGLVFAPAGDAFAAATRLSVEAALTEWLGDLIEVVGVEVTSEDAMLRLDVRYVVRRTGLEALVTVVR